MQSSKCRIALAMLAVLVLLAQPGEPTLVRQMNLGELCERAGFIFRGTVLDARPGTIAIGGGQLPTVTYTLRVDESFKGDFTGQKGDDRNPDGGNRQERGHQKR